jgi:DNA end-binding protein Ku
MHSMWKGVISFGLVMIPVKLYAATEQKDIAFRQVHREDGGRIRFRRICSACGTEVPFEEVAKGFELATGDTVVLTDDDMAELPLPTTRSIEVLQFAPADQLDPILLSRSYYIEPEPAGARAYVLLRNALERSGKVAVVQVALRQRESLATLRCRAGVLVLETLLWPDEVRAADFPFLDEDIEIRSQELKMAASLIDSMTVDFDPGAHRDGYREALQELVDAKAAGRDVLQPASIQIGGGEPVSLADALRASLAAADRQRPAHAGSATAHPAKTGPPRAGAAKVGRTKVGPARASATSGAPKAVTARADSAKAVTAKAVTARAAPAKAATAKAVTAKAVTAKAVTAKAAPAIARPAKAGPPKGEAAKAGLAKAETARAETGEGRPGQG